MEDSDTEFNKWDIIYLQLLIKFHSFLKKIWNFSYEIYLLSSLYTILYKNKCKLKSQLTDKPEITYILS